MEATPYWQAYIWSPYLQQEVYPYGEYANLRPILWKDPQFFIFKEV
jgi:hypothetical protein